MTTTIGTGARDASTWHRARTALLALALLALVLPVANAQPSQQDRERQAGIYFDRGVELYSEGNLDAALVAFERAHELVPSFRVLYNLGQIQAERHEYVAALELFEKYLAEGGAAVPETRKAETRGEIEKLRDRVAELTVRSDVDGAQLFIDGKAVGTLPLSKQILINPGVCRVRVEKSGYPAATRELKVTGGDRLQLDLPLLTASPPTTSAGEGVAQPNYTPLWISSAAAVACGGAAATFGLLARRADRDLDDELARIPVRDDELAADRSKLKTYAALTDGFGAATAVALGLAVYFLIDPPEARPRTEKAAVGSSLRVLPRRGGVGLFGRF